MKRPNAFGIGDLVEYTQPTIPKAIFKDGTVFDPYKSTRNHRGKGVGIVLSVCPPTTDIYSHYLYRVFYHNGCFLWETEENLTIISRYSDVVGEESP